MIHREERASSMRMEADEPVGAASPGRQDAGRTPRWVRAATAPLRWRIATVSLLCGAYLITYALVGDPGLRVGLRPLNLLILVVAGALFGLRGGVGVGLGLAAINIGLYTYDGVFGGSTGRMVGNLLSVAAGVIAGAVLGHTRDLSLTLREEVARREVAERQKNELTELLVHDLKNPLAAILGHSALLMQEEMSEADVKDSSEAIHSAGERLRRMVLNLLDIGRAEDGQLRPRLAEVDLRELILDVRESVHRQMRDRGQRFELTGAAPDVRTLIADPELLRRILINLVDNASKYSPANRPIRLAVESRGDDIVLAVADEGPGIPSGFEERIFDKYVRLQPGSNGMAQDSRGIGLAFCRLATEVHGGRIWVERASPQGSVFRVRLPRSGPRLPSVTAQG